MRGWMWRERNKRNNNKGRKIHFIQLGKLYGIELWYNNDQCFRCICTCVCVCVFLQRSHTIQIGNASFVVEIITCLQWGYCWFLNGFVFCSLVYRLYRLQNIFHGVLFFPLIDLFSILILLISLWLNSK